MDLASVKKAYRFYAPIYDFVFGRIVEGGRKQAVAAFEQKPGDKILEIGVGTGRSLRYYAPHVEVIGIDVSREMLERARHRYLNPNYPQVKALLEMDAQSLEFPDNSFDGVVAMYVASVVPDPAAMVREMFRVCRPGGKIVVVNHFASKTGIFHKVEKSFAPLSKQLGFRPDFCLESFIRQVGYDPVRVSRVNLGGYWRLLEFVSNNGNGVNGTNGHPSAVEFERSK